MQEIKSFNSVYIMADSGADLPFERPLGGDVRHVQGAAAQRDQRMQGGLLVAGILPSYNFV